ncbi:MAG: hypothetical protein ABEK01_02975 [Candidatus Nanohaloarchaea archaeon]
MEMRLDGENHVGVLNSIDALYSSLDDPSVEVSRNALERYERYGEDDADRLEHGSTGFTLESLAFGDEMEDVDLDFEVRIGDYSELPGPGEEGVRDVEEVRGLEQRPGEPGYRLVEFYTREEAPAWHGFMDAVSDALEPDQRFVDSKDPSLYGFGFEL